MNEVFRQLFPIDSTGIGGTRLVFQQLQAKLICIQRRSLWKGNVGRCGRRREVEEGGGGGG